MTANEPRSIVDQLDEVRRTPLDQIPTGRAAELVDRIVERHRKIEHTVDVAMFASAI